MENNKICAITTMTTKNSKRRTFAKYPNPVWPSFIATVAWIQCHRGQDKHEFKQTWRMRHDGVNASIIILSAACIEGFLVECLEDMRVTCENVTFSKLQERFKEIEGKTLNQHLNGSPFKEKINKLFELRNILAHGRSQVLASFDFLGDDFGYEGQYAQIEEWLVKNGLMIRGNNILEDKVADYFAELVVPYMWEVIKSFSKIKFSYIESCIKVAEAQPEVIKRASRQKP